jgi:hypothetical protein
VSLAQAAPVIAGKGATGVGATIMASVERAPWGWALLLTVLAALIKGWPAIADSATRARTAIGDRRMSRIENLEIRMEEQRAAYEAELSILRHQCNNTSACLDALLLLIETAPEKAAAHAARIRLMRVEQGKTESAEKAAIRGAKIAAASNREPEA